MLPFDEKYLKYFQTGFRALKDDPRFKIKSFAEMAEDFPEFKIKPLASFKRKFPPVLLIIYEFRRYIEAGDYDLAEEALDSMMNLLLEKIEPGKQAWVSPYKRLETWQSPRLLLHEDTTPTTYEAILSLGDITAGKDITEKSHRKQRVRLAKVLDPEIYGEEKVREWNLWGYSLMDNLAELVIHHTEYEEENLIGESGKGSKYRTVEWLPGMSNSLLKISNYKNWYTYPSKTEPKWVCNICGNVLIDLFRYEECPSCKFFNPRKNNPCKNCGYIFNRSLGKVRKLEIDCPTCGKSRVLINHFIPLVGEKVSMADDYSCDRCYGGYPLPLSRKSARPGCGWCDNCKKISVAKPIIGKAKNRLIDWIDEQDEQIYQPITLIETLFDKDGDEKKEPHHPGKPNPKLEAESVETFTNADYEPETTYEEGIEDIDEQDRDSLSSIHEIVYEQPRRRNNKDNIWRVAVGLSREENRLDIKLKLSRKAIAQAKKDLAKTLEPFIEVVGDGEILWRYHRHEILPPVPPQIIYATTNSGTYPPYWPRYQWHVGDKWTKAILPGPPFGPSWWNCPVVGIDTSETRLPGLEINRDKEIYHKKTKSNVKANWPWSYPELPEKPPYEPKLSIDDLIKLPADDPVLVTVRAIMKSRAIPGESQKLKEERGRRWNEAIDRGLRLNGKPIPFYLKPLKINRCREYEEFKDMEPRGPYCYNYDTFVELKRN